MDTPTPAREADGGTDLALAAAAGLAAAIAPGVVWIGLAVVTGWRAAFPGEPNERRHEPEPDSA